VNGLKLLLAGTVLFGATTKADSALPGENERSVRAFEAAFGRAIAENDYVAIGRLTAPDWRLIDAEGRVQTREGFIAMIRRGELKHQVVTNEQTAVRMHGRAAVFTARQRSKASFGGRAFDTDEMIIDVMFYAEGRWQLQVTQLTSIQR
jgi:ketosteroid isomerase-like protein